MSPVQSGSSDAPRNSNVRTDARAARPRRANSASETATKSVNTAVTSSSESVTAAACQARELTLNGSDGGWVAAVWPREPRSTAHRNSA